MILYHEALSRCALLICVFLWPALAAAQQAYPSKPIRVIAPYPAGGPAGVLAHVVGQKMTESWGQPVIVDHRPGGNTVIGSEALVKSAPDGYNLIVVNTAHIINAHLLPNLPYDSIKDFAAVGTISSTELVSRCCERATRNVPIS